MQTLIVCVPWCRARQWSTAAPVRSLPRAARASRRESAAVCGRFERHSRQRVEDLLR